MLVLYQCVWARGKNRKEVLSCILVKMQLSNSNMIFSAIVMGKGRIVHPFCCFHFVSGSIILDFHYKKSGRPGKLINQLHPTCRCIMSTGFTPPFRLSRFSYPRGKTTVRFCIFKENFSLRKCVFYDNLKCQGPKKPEITGFLAIRVLPKNRY